MTTSDEPHATILHTNGHVEHVHRGPGESLQQTLRGRISDLGTQGMGRLRVWFTDDFSSAPANTLADRVIGALGYRHPTGWRGTVALTMEEDSTGDCPPLTREVLATLDELTTRS